ncbi:alpha/beta fold hydrolase [Rhodobacteraceae bacterium 2CG4]|uniref:Alpha/beta fold hydrolase n=1 Tax=Halovulum marinum TaxID=2662447 RepID=A0A6L5YWV0_9RHOB|nr:alpha/beta fold hydrolase [Halovulum marinum]MSU88677.1 alpha/beta fold hydrolase [Halovulum marinum]
MRFLLLLLLVLALVGAALWLLGPREPAGRGAAFDPEVIGRDVDNYLYRTERDVPGIIRGAQKHVLWADPAKRDRRPLALVYVHGFSATLEELRPVPDIVARELGANIFYTRLTGHGRDGAALAQASVADWRRDLEEAIAIGREIGERVVLIGTSTGGALITLALEDPALREAVAGVVMISPNFRLKASGASLLTWPFARRLVPMVVGAERFFAPESADHAKWWTERYPSTALLPMAAAVKAARAVDVGAIEVPALFVFSDLDEVVDHRETRAIADAWGGPVTVWPVEPGRGDDRAAHVIAGDILSPGLTGPVAERILEWTRERNLR